MIPIIQLFESTIMKRGKLLLFMGEPMMWDIALDINNKWSLITCDRGDLKKGIPCNITIADKDFHDPWKTPMEDTDTPKSSYAKGTYELKGQFDKDNVDAILIIRGTKLKGEYQLTEGKPSRFLKRKQYMIKKLR